MLSQGSIEWFHNQICINTTAQTPDDYKIGCGSLAIDWSKEQKTHDQAGIKQTTVGKKLQSERLYEKDFTQICSQFRNTQFEQVYEHLKKFYTLGRVRLMKLDYKRCMTWHKDPEHQTRIHYPIITSEGNYMVIENELHHMPQNTWWQTDTSVGHTAFNSSRQDRIHLVAVVL